MTDVVPQKGDRAAWNVAYGSLHASDIAAGTFTYHMPQGTVSGQLPTWNGSAWAVGTVNISAYSTVGHGHAGTAITVNTATFGDRLGTTDTTLQAFLDRFDDIVNLGHVIQDEGTPKADRRSLNFVGSGVTVTDDAGNNATVVNITGGGTAAPGGAVDAALALFNLMGWA